MKCGVIPVDPNVFAPMGINKFFFILTSTEGQQKFLFHFNLTSLFTVQNHLNEIKKKWSEEDNVCDDDGDDFDDGEDEENDDKYDNENDDEDDNE